MLFMLMIYVNIVVKYLNVVQLVNVGTHRKLDYFCSEVNLFRIDGKHPKGSKH